MPTCHHCGASLGPDPDPRRRFCDGRCRSAHLHNERRIAHLRVRAALALLDAGGATTTDLRAALTAAH